VHAAGESSDGNLKPGTYAVVLGVENENALQRVATNLENLKVPVHRVVESSGKYANQLMAIGIKPGPKSERGRWVSTMPLLSMSDFLEFRQRLDWFSDEKKRIHKERVDKLQKEVRENYIKLQGSLWKTLKAAWCGWQKKGAK
jgi:hypothetical protein